MSASGLRLRPRPAAADRGAGDLLILHLESPNRGRQGDHVYRTYQPCRALGELDGVTVVSGSLLSPAVHALLEEADLLVLCDVVDADLLPVLDARRRRGRLSVYEINDNFLAPQPWNPTAYLATNLVSRSLSSQLARRCDALQMTAPALEQRFGPLNAQRRVFPNHLWEVPPLGERAAGADQAVRVGWGGSLGHREDLRWALPALRGAVERDPRVRLAIMSDPSFRPLFDGLPAGRFEHTPAGSAEAYFRFLDSVDIGIAPLLPTEFNRCRSDVKFLEYAAHGVLALCADLEPYRATIRPGENGLLFGDLGELETTLARALSDAGERRAIVARAHAEVARDRLERAHAEERVDFYREVAGALGQRFGGAREAPVFDALAAEPAARTFPGSRYVALGEGPVEELLYGGLRLQQAGNTAEARRRFNEAAARAPGFYLPLMLRSGLEEEPAAALASLRAALGLAPRSVSTRFMLASRLADAGDTASAAHELESCTTLAPGFGAAETRLGELAEAAGRTDEAWRRYERAMGENPHLATPVARLALLAMAEGRPVQALAHLERHLEGDPALGITNLLAGRVYLEMSRFAEARVHLTRALAQTDDRASVLVQLARAEIGLGNIEAARAALDEAKRRSAT